jgi:hypothetical protein
MSIRLTTLSALVALAAAVPTNTAAAQGSSEKPATAPAAKDIDPVGSYQLSNLVQGNPITSSVTITKKTDGTLGGTLSTEAYGVFEFTSVKVSGKTISIAFAAPDGSGVSMTLTLEGDQVTGEWSMGSDGSKVTGKKLP